MTLDDIRKMTGLEVLEAIAGNRIEHPSMAHTLGFRLTEVEHGRAVIKAETDAGYCNPNGSIHGAWPAALLDSCMGSAVHSTLAAGVNFTIVEVKINFVRPVYVDTGVVTAEGTIVRVGRQIGLADGVMRDSNGEVLATGSTTCLISQPANQYLLR